MTLSELEYIYSISTKVLNVRITLNVEIIFLRNSNANIKVLNWNNWIPSDMNKIGS